MDLYKQFPNSRLNFNEEYQELLEILKQNEIITIELLTSSANDISQKIKRPVLEIENFTELLRKESIESFKTQKLSHIDKDEKFCFTTGDSSIDKLLGGGIFTGQITEVFGESSTAKSQFCMQLSRTVQLPVSDGGLNGNAVYISTEGNLETKRMIQINSNLEDVFYINCMDLESQEHILNVQLPTLLGNPKNNIKLVIIDSIAHHLRVELENNNYEDFVQNNNYIDSVGFNLLNLSNKFNISIVVTNQISDKPIKTILNSDYKKITYDYQIGWLNGWKRNDIVYRQENEIGKNNRIATLGLNWTNIVGVRILLRKYYKPGIGFDDHSKENHSRTEQQYLNNNNSNDTGWIMNRSIKLVFSPFAKSDEIKFEVVPDGIRSVSNES